MSIINDALKKVQANIEKKTRPAMPDSSGTAPGPETSAAPASSPGQESPSPSFQSVTRNPSSRQNTWPRAMFSFMLFIICIFTFFFIFDKTSFSPFSRTSRPLIKESPSFPAQRTAAPAPGSSPAAGKQPQAGIDKITIGGIMAMGDRNVVLINDVMYETGDMIKGMEIIEISLDRVKMLENGEVKTFLFTNN